MGRVMLSSPKYEAKERIVPGIPPMWGVWDTFDQSWVEYEEHRTKGSAISAADRHNSAYMRAKVGHD